MIKLYELLHKIAAASPENWEVPESEFDARFRAWVQNAAKKEIGGPWIGGVVDSEYNVFYVDPQTGQTVKLPNLGANGKTGDPANE